MPIPTHVDVKKTLEWLRALSEQALTEARAGDTMLANRLGTNPALKHYFDNIHTRHAEGPEAWAQHYPNYLREADRLRQEVEEAEAQDARMTKVEEGLDKILKWIEAQSGEGDDKEADKSGKKK